MRCDRCGKEIAENFFELEENFWEEFAQSDIEMIFSDVCYNGIRIMGKGYRSLTLYSVDRDNRINGH